MSKKKVTLPADVYDTLELAALAFGGIAAGPHFAYRQDGFITGWDRNCPVCAHGLLTAAVGLDFATPYAEGSPSLALKAAGITGTDSDLAVSRINARKGMPSNSRVTFEEYRAQTNIVRGE